MAFPYLDGSYCCKFSEERNHSAPHNEIDDGSCDEEDDMCLSALCTCVRVYVHIAYTYNIHAHQIALYHARLEVL